MLKAFAGDEPAFCVGFLGENQFEIAQSFLARAREQPVGHPAQSGAHLPHLRMGAAQEVVLESPEEKIFDGVLDGCVFHDRSAEGGAAKPKRGAA